MCAEWCVSLCVLPHACHLPSDPPHKPSHLIIPHAPLSLLLCPPLYTHLGPVGRVPVVFDGVLCAPLQLACDARPVAAQNGVPLAQHQLLSHLPPALLHIRAGDGDDDDDE